MEPKVKIWLERDGSFVLGGGRAALLDAIHRTGSISSAAKELGISYKHAWNMIRDMEATLGEKVVETRIGGRDHGGAKLTGRGVELLEEFKILSVPAKETIADKTFWEALGLKISARNRIKGKVKSVEKDGVVAKVKIDVDGPVTITSVVTSEAASFLKLEEGDEVEAIIKATEVMVGKE